MRVSHPVGGSVGGMVDKLRGWIAKNF
jgi:cell division protein FtsA